MKIPFCLNLNIRVWKTPRTSVSEILPRAINDWLDTIKSRYSDGIAFNPSITHGKRSSVGTRGYIELSTSVPSLSKNIAFFMSVHNYKRGETIHEWFHQLESTYLFIEKGQKNINIIFAIPCSIKTCPEE